jgi:hypothetical protein
VKHDAANPCAELLQVVPQDSDQYRRDRHRPINAGLTLLEPAPVVQLA